MRSWTYQQSVLSAITVTNISKSFTHKMAVKINRHRYGTNYVTVCIIRTVLSANVSVETGGGAYAYYTR